MSAPNLHEADTRSQAERDFHQHMIRWGSDGYPVQKMGRRWLWVEFWGVKGAPTTYRTKREAVAAIERYLDVLCDKSAGRL